MGEGARLAGRRWSDPVPATLPSRVACDPGAVAAGLRAPRLQRVDQFAAIPEAGEIHFVEQDLAHYRGEAVVA
jgi:hypothetical protein